MDKWVAPSRDSLDRMHLTLLTALLVVSFVVQFLYRIVLSLHLLNLDLSYYITIIVYYAKRQQNTYQHKYNFAIFAYFVNWY